MSGFKLFLDSRYSSYRSDDTSPTDLNFNINSILSDNYDVYKVALLEMSMPNIENCFKTGINNTLNFYENGGAVLFSASILPGTYSGVDMATEIARAMNATPGIANSYSASYNQSTLKLTITANIPNTFSILSNSTCLQELGFAPTNTGFAVSHTSPYVVNLIPTRYVDIVINHGTNSLSTGLTNRSNILARCKFSVPYGSVEKYEIQTPMYHTVSRTALSTIELRVYNDKSRLVQLSPNHSITFTLDIQPVQ